MGNCLVIHQGRKEIKVMSIDGSQQVLKMPSPGTGSSLKVQEDLAAGSVLPVKQAAPAAVVVDDPGSAVRVKLVISKQELKRMLDREGMSLDDMVALMRKEAASCGDREQECCGGWRPALESIPEGSDLLLYRIQRSDISGLPFVNARA